MTYDKRNRDNLETLAPNTKRAAYKLYQFAIDNNIDILIYEARRTVATQRKYVAKGASQTMKSYHIVGQAIDFVVVKGKECLWNGYASQEARKIVAYAKTIGFTWGGDWVGFKDSPHLQFGFKGYGSDVSLVGEDKVPAQKLVPDAPPIVPFIQKLKTGSKGKDVQRVQRAVGVEPDGVYGYDTKKAVMKYQDRKGLEVDGIVGQKTWNMLF